MTQGHKIEKHKKLEKELYNKYFNHEITLDEYQSQLDLNQLIIQFTINGRSYNESSEMIEQSLNYLKKDETKAIHWGFKLFKNDGISKNYIKHTTYYCNINELNAQECKNYVDTLVGFASEIYGALKQNNIKTVSDSQSKLKSLINDYHQGMNELLSLDYNVKIYTKLLSNISSYLHTSYTEVFYE